MSGPQRAAKLTTINCERWWRMASGWDTFLARKRRAHALALKTISHPSRCCLYAGVFCLFRRRTRASLSTCNPWSSPCRRVPVDRWTSAGNRYGRRCWSTATVRWRHSESFPAGYWRSEAWGDSGRRSQYRWAGDYWACPATKKAPDTAPMNF